MPPHDSTDPRGDRRPRRLPLSHRRAFVAHHTRLRPVAGVEGIRLHLADDAAQVWQATEEATGTTSAPIPFWAFAWAGGLALARYLADRPADVRDRRVLDFATGSGLVAIAAAKAGASAVIAADIDPFAEAAVELNARANRIRVEFVGRDLLAETPPADVDVLLAGDTWYEGPFAERVQPWLRAAADSGIRVLVGDPGRRYLPAEGLTEIAAYEVETTTQLEDRAVVVARVFEIDPSAESRYQRSVSPPAGPR
ncbi:MAG: class I SAM-dependent methyltransferase [Chloroflexota bacterium]